MKPVYLASPGIVRTFGILFLLLGGVAFGVRRFLQAVLVIAGDLIEKAFARYSSFTGKIALGNFQEDKILYQKVKYLNDSLMPIFHALEPVLFWLSIALFAIAFLCFILPNSLARFLSFIKIWKILPEGENEKLNFDFDENKENQKGGKEMFSQDEQADKGERLCSSDEKSLRLSKKKKIGIISISFILLLLIASIPLLTGPSKEMAGKEISENFVAHVDFIKEEFSKSKKIVKRDAPPASDFFEYKILPSGGLSATLSKKIENCPAKSTWTVIPSVQGLFQKTLSFSKKAPKDPLCREIFPGFNHIVK